MLIKAADDIEPQIDALEALLRRTDLAPRTRSKIELEVRTMRAGAQGERDAAYELEFHCAKNKNQATIHGLRLEIEGRTAQIDHLIINRLLDIWVCESKHFAAGVEINEHGEWAMRYQGRSRGIPSPVEQNNRHIAVLADAFKKGYVALPSRLGVSVKPWIRGLVLISNDAQISRPVESGEHRVKGLESVVKVERAIETINKDFDTRNPAALLKVVTAIELEAFARGLAALHVPAKFDWQARFGVTAIPAAAMGVSHRLNRPHCITCGRGVPDSVIAFCESRPSQFAGKVYCVDCQIPIVTGRG
jgi:hypothetical protein